MGGPDLLERVDRIMSELLELRAMVAGAEGNGLDAEPQRHGDAVVDDLADSNLLDTTSAQERFGHPRNTIAKWCRMEGLGVRRGGRWLVSVPRLVEIAAVGALKIKHRGA
jgi:hypothetical protein